MPAATTRVDSRRYAVLLGALTLLFALRVLGQLVAALLEPSWLPPFARWYSGLLPYPALLPVQILILALMLKVVRDFARGGGFFIALRPGTGTVLVWCSYLYALAMAVRYVVTMSLHPELRWFTGTIPIWFHFVLAAFLYLVGRYQRRRGAGAAGRP
jgi:hypothetical protein